MMWGSSESPVRSFIRRVNIQQTSLSDKSKESYLCLVPVINEGYQSMRFTFKQVSSFLEVSEYVKYNAYSMIIQAGTFASLQTFLGERHRHDIDSDISLLRPESIDSFPLPYLQNQTLIHWHFHQRVTWSFVWLHLPTVRWSQDTLLTGVNMCFGLSQGQAQLNSLCKILGHFSFSLSSLRHLFITGRVLDVCSSTLWKAPGCL